MLTAVDLHSLKTHNPSPIFAYVVRTPLILTYLGTVSYTCSYIWKIQWNFLLTSESIVNAPTSRSFGLHWKTALMKIAPFATAQDHVALNRGRGQEAHGGVRGQE